MINNEKLHIILKKDNHDIEEKINVIVKYIFDLKQEDITVININPPQNHVADMLMNHMFQTAKQYYLNGK